MTATVAGLWGYGKDGWHAALGFSYRVEDSALNVRTFIDHEAFFIDLQEEAKSGTIPIFRR